MVPCLTELPLSSIKGVDMTTQIRSKSDRRTGSDRRKIFSLKHFRFHSRNRRKTGDRRLASERRHGWVRLTRWSSVNLSRLKISRYLKLPE
jgi:hypothetical protein